MLTSRHWLGLPTVNAYIEEQRDTNVITHNSYKSRCKKLLIFIIVNIIKYCRYNYICTSHNPLSWNLLDVHINFMQHFQVEL